LYIPITANSALFADVNADASENESAGCKSVRSWQEVVAKTQSPAAKPNFNILFFNFMISKI
jgi:hypothetical protein